ncbi:MAG: MATE family efflux transporter [Polyangiaceae bacterium]|nr:MATE family efflux transporter [Polyangiaceae bacterium]
MNSQLIPLLRAGAPLALASLAQTLVGTLAVGVAGRIGERELAAVGLGSSLFFTVAVFGVGLLLGIDPIVSAAVGRGDREGVRSVVGQGLLLAVVTALPLAGVIVLAAGALGPSVLPVDTGADLARYVWGRVPGLAPHLAFVVLRSAAAAQERTRRVFWAATVATACVVLLAPALGSRLGVLGVGLAESAGGLVQALVLARASVRPSFSRRLALVWAIASTGLPVGLALVAEYAVFASLGWMVAVVEPGRLGAHQVAMAWLGTLFMLPVGFGAGVAAAVGRALGRADAIAAKSGWRTGAWVSLVLGMLLGAPLVLFPAALSSWVSNDPELIAAASPLVRTAGFVLVADSVQVVLVGAARGAGETRFALGACLAGHYLVGLPLGVLLALRAGLGAVGLWLGLGIGLTTIACLLGLRIRRTAELEPSRWSRRSRESSSPAPWLAPLCSPHRRALPASPRPQP